MARRQRQLPGWATRTYGSDEVAWETAKQQCRATLYEWARHDDLPRPWGELIRHVDAIHWPPGDATSGQLGWLLGQVALEELSADADRPIISAMGYNRSEAGPGGGFWALFPWLVPSTIPHDRDAFWIAEIRRCQEFYGRRPPR